MKVHRTKHTANFTIAPNAILREERMSEMARLILLRLLSNADDYEGATALKMWEDAREVRGDAAPGKRAFLNAFSEMEAFGYLVRTKVREGSKWVTHVDVYDTPQNLPEEDPGDDSPGLPGIGKPEGGKPEPGKSETGQSSKRTTEKDASRSTTSSSSGEVEDITNVIVPPQTKKRTESPEAIIERRLGCTTDEAAKVATLINQQGDGRGGRIRSLSWWVENRDLHTLRQDLAIVRGHQGPAGVPKPLDEGERIRRMQKGGYQPYKNPVDQDVYDEPLLPVPEKAHTGVRAPVPDHAYWDTITDEQYAQQWRSS